MKSVDLVVDTICGQLVKRYRYDCGADCLGLARMYKEKECLINNLYKEAFYWHGSGRYHYQHNGKSKYHSEYNGRTTDVLESLVKQNGLTPQYDFWSRMSTISLTRHRVHARGYAQFHQDEETDLDYTYGSTKFWYYTLALKLAFTNNPWRNVRNTDRMRKDTEFNRQLAQWAGYVRSNNGYSRITITNFYKLRSDISGNYGILLGIKKSAVDPVSFHPTIERFEVRSGKPITFEQMTHLEVPLKNLEETDRLIRRYGIALPLIPIELGELYLNRMNFRTLAQ